MLQLFQGEGYTAQRVFKSIRRFDTHHFAAVKLKFHIEQLPGALLLYTFRTQSCSRHTELRGFHRNHWADLMGWNTDRMREARGEPRSDGMDCRDAHTSSDCAQPYQG